MIKLIKEQLEILKQADKKVEKILEKTPEGKLKCRVCRSNYQYFIGNQYLRKDQMKYIQALAQKEYNEKLLKIIKKYKKHLEEIFKLYSNNKLEEIYRELHPGRKVLVDPIIHIPELQIEEFEKTVYKGKGFSEDDTTEYYTAKGERVRSKSEKIIADELNRRGIPYKYEMPIELEENGRKFTIYPDFTAINKRTGKKIIIEHLGMMDKNNYYNMALNKIDSYEKNNYLIGRDVIIFHETSNSPINTNVVRKYIEMYLC